MDRSYKAEDEVRVFTTNKRESLVATVHRVPYTKHGFDYYQYKGQVYPAYVNQSERFIWISLDNPFR